ncbi:PLP-dependent aminotransferase family protein [Desulfovibrio sp. JC022]|uniref:aminotransferase-like domain-containing protein n=1 Tax=Desulfovibrio sp. JC022 TaxID=2593642 RepID=UPI0013D2E4E0|nr:PLP-dependent aminotransferase family protein [Desulfovibrio sp. JC022]NDV24164.1 PLP-dependent aminotransferase family protein [Desulfovibrio sp. JC022]
MTKWIPELEGSARPKFKQLADAIERDVYAGKLCPGDKLPTHRDLADDLKMNVSTVTRGYAEAEKRGFISGTVGRGTFIASDAITSSSMVTFEPHAPGMIELGMVNTFYDLDPDIQDGMKRLTRRRNLNAFLRYTDPQGLPEHREVGAQWAKRYRLDASAGDVLVCSGAQHALTCCLSSLFRAGDRIATDALIYPGMKTLANMLGIRLVPVPMDDQGMIPEQLDRICRREKINGVSLMPGVQNPTSGCMSVERREQIAMICCNHDLTIIEDDAYALTVESDLPPVTSFAPERSVFIAGLSKSIAVGLRVAFMVAQGERFKALAHAILNSVWMTPPLNVELISQWIQDGTADITVKLKRQAARRRFDAVKDLLDGMGLGANPSGFFLWLSLPKPWKGYMVEQRAREAGLNIFGAEKFAVGGGPVPANIRLSLSGPKDIAQLRKGLGILREIFFN